MIEKIKKDDSDRTMMHADVANEVIEAVNGLMEMSPSNGANGRDGSVGGWEVSPSGMGEFVVAGSTVKLVLNTFEILMCMNGQPAFFTIVGKQS